MGNKEDKMWVFILTVGTLILGLWVMFNQKPEDIARDEEDDDSDDYNVARPFNDTDNG